MLGAARLTRPRSCAAARSYARPDVDTAEPHRPGEAAHDQNGVDRPRHVSEVMASREAQHAALALDGQPIRVRDRLDGVRGGSPRDTTDFRERGAIVSRRS